jgi:hypothetical protein
MGGELSNACVSGRDSLVALLTLVLVTEGTVIDPRDMPSCFSPPVNGVGASLAIAFSGMTAAMLLFDLRSSSSRDTVFLISLNISASLGRFSFSEKLSLRCAVDSICCSGVSLRGVLFSGSTDTKFVRTLEIGRLVVSPLLRALGDRPRTSGDAG